MGDLRAWLGGRGEIWRRELADRPNTDVALNHDYVCNDAVTNGDELAFFPPVTGG